MIAVLSLLLWLAAAVVLVLGARQGTHELARRTHWRIGRLSKLLPGWNEQACLRCQTSYTYARPHGTPTEIDGVRGYVYPLCQGCWEELGAPVERIPFYEMLFAEWAADPTVNRTIGDLYAIRSAVAAGL